MRILLPDLFCSTSNGLLPFMMFWNGISWSNIGVHSPICGIRKIHDLILGTTLEGNSNISQLLMVPLQNTHSSNAIVEADRMLMVSGSLSDSTFGSASSVLFDGESLIPYISAVSAQGTMGFISALFYSIANFSFVQQRMCGGRAYPYFG